MDEEVLRVSTKRYKSSLPPSWRKVADQSEFFLGKKEGKAWRWGRKGGQYYYDYDHIPNRKPDLLPGPAALERGMLIGARRGSKVGQQPYRRNRIVDTLDEKVKNYESVDDFIYFSTFTIGDKDIFDTRRARDLQQAAAWCRFLKNAPALIENGSLGFRTLTGLYKVCAARIEKLDLTGFRIKSAESLRKKIAALPDGEAMLAALVSGKYCNDNRRILGKSEIVDYATGEVMKYDAHQATIMSYWLNPGRSQKDSKQTLYGLYAYDMECLNIEPVKLSTFTHYINKWDNRYLSAAERHGKVYAKNAFRPYVPSKPLEYANSLWVSDGSASFRTAIRTSTANGEQ